MGSVESAAGRGRDRRGEPSRLSPPSALHPVQAFRISGFSFSAIFGIFGIKRAAHPTNHT
eukprot:scaffold3834_cov179-Ochromonas_danica.AAC.12